MTDEYKRQLKLLETYISGRIKHLERIAHEQPGEAIACEMAKSELTTILITVLPEMRKV